MEANRKYKDTLFSKLFSKPQSLRELYNALADTEYGEDIEIEINTLENVFFNDLKNDVSFTIDDKYVVILEHQSTINENMPLRCLMYIARVFEKITDERAIYQEKLQEIPTPEFIVLYNGVKHFPSEQTLRLSDAYKGTEKSIKRFGDLDLTVRVVNINPGNNDELLQKSEILSDYTAFVERVRYNQRNGNILRTAIEEAIKWGIARGLLGTYLIEHESEVTNMLMTEFNIDIAKEVWQDEIREKYDAELTAKDAELTAKDAELTAKDNELVAQAALIKELQAKLAEHEKQAKPETAL